MKQPNPKLLYYIALYGFVLLVFSQKFGFQILDTSFTGWMFLVGSDMVPDYATWEYYRYSPLEPPMGVISGYAWPQLTGIGNTNIVPWIAMPLHWIHDFLPETFQYFGWFFLICYVLQAYFGDKLLRLFGVENHLYRFIGTAFLVISAALLYRSWHIALSAHFFVLASLCLYFDHQTPLKKGIYFGVLSFFSVLTHPYLILFPLAIGFGTLVNEWRKKEIRWPAFIGINAVNALGVLIGGWISGIFSLKISTATDYGLGYFSAALDTFINSQERTAFKFLGMPTYFEGQYEGYGYLGFGVLLLWIWVMVDRHLRSQLLPLAKKHWPLLMIVVLMTIYATGLQFTMYNWFKVGIRMKEGTFVHQMLSIFRSSGRYIWLLHQILLIMPVLLISRYYSKRLWAIGLVSICSLVQYIDIRGAFNDYDFKDHYQQFDDRDQLVSALQHVNGAIYTMPMYMRTMANNDDMQYLVAALGKYQKNITAGHLPRQDFKLQGSLNNDMEIMLREGRWKLTDEDVILCSFHEVYNYDNLQRQDTNIIIKQIGDYALCYRQTNGRLHQAFKALTTFELKTIHLKEFIDQYQSDHYILVTTRDEASSKFDSLARKAVDFSQLSTIDYRQTYYGIWKNGNVLSEKKSDQQISIDTTLNQDNHSIRLELGATTGPTDHSEYIRIDGTNHSKQKRGINIVVLDSTFNVVAIQQFDTYRFSIAALLEQ